MFERITFYVLAFGACLVGVFTLAVATNVVQALIAFLLFTMCTLLVDAVAPATPRGRTPSNLKGRSN